MRWRKLTGIVLDFCYPARCFACRRPHDGAGTLCAGCDGELGELQTTPACPCCARPLARQEAPCPWCRGKGAAHLDRVARLGPYVEPLRSLVHQMKYRRAWTLAEDLCDRLMEVEPARRILDEAEVLVPVPLHRLRQIARGYNQAEVMARRLGRAAGVAVAGPLMRLRHTETQTRLLSHARRYDNLRDAFALTGARAVAGKRVVLIDDVLTSGATLHSVAAVVRVAQARSVSAIVLAVADPRGYERPKKPGG